jgi:DNA repair photolyase
VARFTVREINCKSAINRVRGMPFSWSLNPYRGCRHACVYCYARPTHEYMGLDAGAEFQEIIFAKVNAPEVVRAELKRPGWRGETVVIGTATDPYQQAESQYRITRGILEAFRDAQNPVGVTTKSPMILRDLDVLAALNEQAEVVVCVTVTTVDEKLWRLIEPTTSKPRKRLDAIAILREHGIRAGVLLSPILPGITDDLDHMEDVVSAAAAAGASFLSGNTLRLGPGISEYYLPFIEREFPKLKARYDDLYRGNYAPGYYSDTIRKRLDDLRLKYRLTEDRPVTRAQSRAVKPRPQQLDLFAAVA